MRVAALGDVPVLALVPLGTPCPGETRSRARYRWARMRLLPGWASAKNTAPIMTARPATAATAVGMSPAVVPSSSACDVLIAAAVTQDAASTPVRTWKRC